MHLLELDDFFEKSDKLINEKFISHVIELRNKCREQKEKINKIIKKEVVKRDDNTIIHFIKKILLMNSLRCAKI